MIDTLKHIYIVVCNGISDLGKGWLAASIGSIDAEHTLPIKIDPLLNQRFPQHIGIPIQELCDSDDIARFLAAHPEYSAEYHISDDFETYHAAGMKVHPECNIVAGDLLSQFINLPDVFIRPGEFKKKTFTDLSYFLAEQLIAMGECYQPTTMIIEVGGILEDYESIYIPGAMRFLRTLTGVTPELILLTYFEQADGNLTDGKYRLKTQHIRRGIKHVQSLYYDLPLKACIVRRRNVATALADTILEKELENVRYETQLAAGKLIYIPNVNEPTLADNLQRIRRILEGSFR